MLPTLRMVGFDGQIRLGFPSSTERYLINKGANGKDESVFIASSNG